MTRMLRHRGSVGADVWQRGRAERFFAARDASRGHRIGSIAVQLHHAELDPWIERDEVRNLSDAVSAAGGRLEVHRYEGTAHLFADEQLVEHDEGKAAAMFSRVAAFLASLEG
jgi:dienelactone hydrolase